jgi:hypothetical protein
MTKKLLEEKPTGWRHHQLLVSLVYEVGQLHFFKPYGPNSLIVKKYLSKVMINWIFIVCL